MCTWNTWNLSFLYRRSSTSSERYALAAAIAATVGGVGDGRGSIIVAAAVDHRGGGDCGVVVAVMV